MGYLTNYKLDIIGNTDVDHYEELEEISGYYIDEDFSEGYKWYNHENDLKEYSLKYPHLLFKLEGVGEESEDMWIKYFKNGKMQVCCAIITFPEFNESKLK